MILNPLPTRPFSAFLFDMDGTLLSSIAAAERVWSRWAQRHGLDVAAFLPTIHGMRSVETVRRLNLPGVDAQAEADAITAEEMVDLAGVEPIPGVRELIATLPAGRWAVVTSAPRELALRRIEAAGLPRPTASCSPPTGWACTRPTAWCSRTPPPASPPQRPRAPAWSSSRRRTRIRRRSPSTTAR